MNKLARREYDYIKGNTVLAPERKHRVVRKPDKRYKEIRRRKLNNKHLLLKNRRKSDRKYLTTVAGVIVTLGLLTILGDNKVYNTERTLDKLNGQISAVQADNEALKVKILKFSSLNNIQQSAQNKLSMFVPSKKETVRIDFSENYFKDVKPKSSENSTKEEGFFSKLIYFTK